MIRKLKTKRGLQMKVVKVLSGLVMLGLTVGLVGCGAKQKSSQDDSVSKIKQQKVLTVGTSADFAPFEFPIVKNGKKEIVGFDIMLAQKIAAQLGVKLKVVNIEFPSLISELNNNKTDLVISGLSKTKKRQKAVLFSKPYYKVENVLLVKKGQENKYQTLSDLNGKQLGAQQASTQEDLVKKQLPKANLVSEAVLTSLTTELANGQLDGVVMESATANNYVKQFPNKYALAKVSLTDQKEVEAYSVAAKKGDQKLIKVVNKVIDQIKKDGQDGEMLSKAQALQAQNAQ